MNSHLPRIVQPVSSEAAATKRATVLAAVSQALDARTDRGMHVVFLAHSTVKKFEAPDQAGSYDRFELKLGSFEVAEILELFTTEVAPHYYNRAIFDTQTLLKERFESIESDLWSLEKP